MVEGKGMKPTKRTITFLFMYYWPEVPTISYIYGPLIQKYKDKGYRINVVAPNPVRGITKDKIKKYNKNTIERIDENLTVYRVKCFTYQKYSKWNLLRRYMSVSWRCARKLKKIRTDEVFLQTSPPIFYAYWGAKIAKKKGAHIIYNVQDIYPDNIKKTSSLFYKTINFFKKKTLKLSDRIITISEDMLHTLEQKGNFANKIEIIPNRPTAVVEAYDKAKLLSIRNKFNIDRENFNVVYAGNIGYLQDVDIILSAAKLLIHNKTIQFRIIGEGAQAERIKKRIVCEDIMNVQFFPPVSMEDSPYIYKVADANVISLLPGVIKTACPLKTAMIIQAGQQIIAAVDEDSHYAKDLKEQYDAVIVPEQNEDLLVEQLKILANKKLEKTS